MTTTRTFRQKGKKERERKNQRNMEHSLLYILARNRWERAKIYSENLITYIFWLVGWLVGRGVHTQTPLSDSFIFLSFSFSLFRLLCSLIRSLTQQKKNTSKAYQKLIFRMYVAMYTAHRERSTEKKKSTWKSISECILSFFSISCCALLHTESDFHDFVIAWLSLRFHFSVVFFASPINCFPIFHSPRATSGKKTTGGE